MPRSDQSISRRRALQGVAGLAAASTLPWWFAEEVLAQDKPQQPRSANDKPNLALVGCGGMGRGDLKNAARFGRVVALCDVDEGHVAAAGKDWPDAACFTDLEQFRAEAEAQCAAVTDCLPAEGVEAVLLPGQPELAMRAAREREGVPIPDSTWQELQSLARDHGVTLPADPVATS